jgi:hypothetical protein
MTIFTKVVRPELIKLLCIKAAKSMTKFIKTIRRIYENKDIFY